MALDDAGRAQAAGIGAAVPTRTAPGTNLSTDFSAQGLANIGGGVFQALPTGGSLSRIGVSTSAGGRTRWVGVYAGLWLALIVVTLGPFAELIPMPVIGGLMLVIGGEPIAGRIPDIRLVLRTRGRHLQNVVLEFCGGPGQGQDFVAVMADRGGGDRDVPGHHRHPIAARGLPRCPGCDWCCTAWPARGTVRSSRLRADRMAAGASPTRRPRHRATR